MKICSKQPELCVKSTVPSFKYRFPEADKPVEVDESHTEKILRNSNFYKYDKQEKSNESFINELKAINGIGEKTAKDIIKVFRTKENIIKTIESGEDLPFDDDVSKKLKEVFS